WELYPAVGEGWRSSRNIYAAERNCNRRRRSRMGRRRGAGHSAVLHGRRSFFDVDGRAWIVPRAVPGIGRALHRQEQSNLSFGAVPGTSADVPLLHRRRGASADQAAPGGDGSEEATKGGEHRSSRECWASAPREFCGAEAAIEFGY